MRKRGIGFRDGEEGGGDGLEEGRTKEESGKGIGKSPGNRHPADSCVGIGLDSGLCVRLGK
jgi:hypothetical protein